MPDTNDDDLFGDLGDDDSDDSAADDESDDDDFAPQPDMTQPDTDSADEMEMVREAIAECAELGVVVPDSVSDCKDFVAHLLTAMKTHKATKAVHGNGGAEAVAQTGDDDMQTEEAPAMMSLNRHYDPAVRILGGELERNRRKGYLKRIARLEKIGTIKPDHAADLRKEAGAIQLSLTRSGDSLAKTNLDDVLAALERVPVPEGINLNTIRSVANPLDTSAEVQEMIEKLTSK